MYSELKTNTRTEQILSVMRVLTWIAYIGLMIQAGSILISYAVSVINPEAAKNLYQGLNLYHLKQSSFWNYSSAVSFMVALIVMKASIAHLVIKSLSKVNLVNPFTTEVVSLLEKMSYFLVATSCIALMNNAYNSWLLKRTGFQLQDLNKGEYLFMAGLVFIISQVFKRGVEIQSENDLTV